MEAVCAVATILSLADISIRLVSALIDYSRNTTNASNEQKLLINEAVGLLGLLERLKRRESAGSTDELWQKQNSQIITQFQATLDDLAQALSLDSVTGQPKPKSRLKGFTSTVKWSFNKSEVYSLIERISRLQQYASTLLLDKQHDMIQSIDSNQRRAIDLRARDDIAKWLTDINEQTVHDAIVGRATKGSGTWFFDCIQFENWTGPGGPILWCSGIPGAGKTVLASLTVERLRGMQRKGTENFGLGFVYFKYNNPDQSITNVLGSLIKQLVLSLPDIPDMLTEIFHAHHDGADSVEQNTLIKLLEHIVAEYPKVYFVIDALDECNDQTRWDITTCLINLTPSARSLITSRRLDTIAEELADVPHKQIQAHPEDIELYIDSVVEKQRNLRRMTERSPKLRQEIKRAVVKNADGMFLLARLHLESLMSAAALSISHVKRKLQTLPNSLSQTYDEAILRIEAQPIDQREVALRTLAWVSYVFRPLTLHELQHALAIEPGMVELDEEYLIDGHNITSLCAGLIIVDPGTTAVNLVHHTAKRHFESIRATKFPGFHATITMNCAIYLSLKQLKGLSLMTIVKLYPLACYAAQYMGDHARQNPEDDLEVTVLQGICALLTHPEKRQPLLSLLDGMNLSKTSWSSSLDNDTNDSSDPAEDEPTTLSHDTDDQDSEFDESGDDDDDNSTLVEITPAPQTIAWESRFRSSHMAKVTALHLAASMGLARVAALLLQEVPDVDVVDETGKTALSVAMERGFEKAVELLVNSGAVVDLTNPHGQAVFLRMVESDWHSIAEVLAIRIEEDNDIQNTAGNSAEAMLIIAAYRGDVAKLHSDPVNATTAATNPIALFVAVERGHIEFIKALLEAGVDINSRDSSGQTALHRATRRQNADLMRLLVHNECELDAKDDLGRTPWSANLRSARKDTLDILIDFGSDPNTRGHQGVSELYTAGENGEIAVIRTMLESGTNPSIKTQFLWTPLHWAAFYGHTECVKLLLNAGAEPSAVSDQDATPLDLALRAKQTEIAEMLKKHGALETSQIPLEQAKPETFPEGWTLPLRTLSNPLGGTKLSLIFDRPTMQGIDVGQFIYPATIQGPVDYIYQISDQITFDGVCMYIRRAKKRVDMVEYPLATTAFPMDDILYTIERHTGDLQRMRLRSGTQVPELNLIEMHKDWTGGFKIHREVSGNQEYLCRTTPDWSKTRDQGCRWSTEDGTLLARSNTEGSLPTIALETEPDRLVQDILVACWVAKLWFETATPNFVTSPGHARRSSKNKF